MKSQRIVRFIAFARIRAGLTACRWDVTGWMTVNPNASITDDSVLACIACMGHEPTTTCAEAVAPVYADVCREGSDEANRKERALVHRLQNDPEEWCSLKCDFTGLANRAGSQDAGGLEESDIHCMHILLSSCEQDVLLHQEHAERVKRGSARRHDIMNPFTAESEGMQLTAPIPDPEHLEESAMAPEGEEFDDAAFQAHAFSHMQHRLDWIMDHRRSEMLPPAPALCSTCRNSGLDSTSCRIAVDDLAKTMCVDGDELQFCSGMGLRCTPYPSDGGPAARMHNDAPHDPEVAATHEREGRHPHAPAETGPLSTQCASLVERVCMYGLVMPGKNIRHIEHPQGLHPADPAFTSEQHEELKNSRPRMPHEEL